MVRFIIIAVTGSLLIACGESGAPAVPSTAPSASQPHDPFADGIGMEIVPNGDGTAYVSVALDGLWYVRGAEAVRVKEVAQFSSAALNPLPSPSPLPAMENSLRRQAHDLRELQQQFEGLKSAAGK